MTNETLVKIEGNTKPCRESLKRIGAVEIDGILMIKSDWIENASRMVEYANSGKMTASEIASNRRPIKMRRATTTDRWNEFQTGGEA